MKKKVIVSSSYNSNSYRVCVVIPAYNCGEVIGRTIDSVLSQTRPAQEIIVVDDGSTDDTGAEVEKFGSKVRYIAQVNAGPSAARNRGIEAAGCEWIAFLDGDDEWLPEKLEKQLGLLERHPELVWTTGNFWRCLCGTERRACDIAPTKAKRLLGGKDFFDSYFRAYTAQAAGWTGSMLIKRSVLHEAGLFRESLNSGEDLDMWWRIAYRWPQIGYVTEPVAIYHLGTPESLSQSYFDLELYQNLIKRHLELSAQQNRREDFEQCAAFTIRRWIRGMLFYKRGDDIRRLMEQFDQLLPEGYKKTMRILTMFPGATAGVCRAISRVVRLFNLRRGVFRPPKKLYFI
ncbi:glycosyltransferase family 2 protein [Planctomycetota bacterium]